uniref:Uncharacterized protein n=1 Tax=Rhizophora mucronata TaxID=61149 RepID=A0A2P2P462_RHIMU
MINAFLLFIHPIRELHGHVDRHLSFFLVCLHGWSPFIGCAKI